MNSLRISLNFETQDRKKNKSKKHNVNNFKNFQKKNKNLPNVLENF